MFMMASSVLLWLKFLGSLALEVDKASPWAIFKGHTKVIMHLVELEV